MLNPDLLRSKFEQGLPFADYIRSGSLDHRVKWEDVHSSIALTPEQEALIRGFSRRINVLVISGIWCGDCSSQGPIPARIAAANPDVLGVRFLDRDEHTDLGERVRICSGLRVPTTIFCNEDFDFMSLFGDRTLTRYRALAAKKVGSACELPGAPTPMDELTGSVREWLNEFERVQWMARLSPKLRQLHGD